MSDGVPKRVVPEMELLTQIIKKKHLYEFELGTERKCVNNLAARDMAIGKTPMDFPPNKYSDVELAPRQA